MERQVGLGSSFAPLKCLVGIQCRARAFLGQQKNPSMRDKMSLAVVSSAGAFTPWELRFRQCSLSHIDRVSRRMD
jgi:hypothetical protein